MPPSAAATFPAAGTFYWAAFYSGDPSNGAAASDCATEPLVVTPAPSQVTTQLSATGGEIPVGGSASDAATLNGVTGTAGGTVEYRFYDSLSACQTATGAFPGTAPSGGTLVSTVTVTGGVAPPSASATFDVAGTFYWAAFYSGDASNQAAASTCATEPLVVTPAQSQVTTSVVGPWRGDQHWRVGERLRDAARRHRHRGRDRGVPVLRFAGRLPVRDLRVPAGQRRHPGVHRDGDRRRGAGIGSARLRRRGHLLLGRVLLRRPQATSRTPATAPPSPWSSSPAQSQVTTQLSAAGAEIAAGGSASDSATLHGVTGTAGGTVDYRYYESLPACDSDVAAFPGTPPPGGTLVSTRDRDRRRGAALGRAHVRRRGHLLLGRVLLRRPRQPRGRQHLRHRAPGRHPGGASPRPRSSSTWTG